MVSFINNICEVSSQYTHYIFDLWGVIHDGSNLYPNVKENLKKLRSQNKSICFLSNAPRRSFVAEEVLSGLGVEKDYYDFIITSGESLFIDMARNQSNGYKEFGKNFSYFGPDKDKNLLNGLDYKIVDIKEANFAIITGFKDDSSTIEMEMPNLELALKHNITMICANPDFKVVKQNGLEYLCAGILANKYEELGGKVIYYGKPFSAVYQLVMEKFRQLNGENPVKPRNVLAIGDAFETDIKGASSADIDCVIISGGIYSSKLQETAINDKITILREVDNLLNKHHINNSTLLFIAKSV